MPDVDFDRAWLRLKAHIAEKRSHGQDGLFAEMARIEVECATDPNLTAHDGPLRPGMPLASPDALPEKATPLAAEEAANGSRHQRDPETVG